MSYSIHDIRILEETPDIDHRFSLEIRLRIGRVRSAKDQDIALADHVIERKKISSSVVTNGSVVRTFNAHLSNAFFSL